MSVKLIVPLVLAISLGCKRSADSAPSVQADTAAPEPKIGLEAARNTALTRIPGKVVEEELEQEHGRLVYSFEIQPTGAGVKLKEVHVDANDGSIVAVEDEEEDDKDDKGEKDDEDE